MGFDAVLSEMRADAEAIAARTAHWREAAPPVEVRRGYFRPGSRQARMFALMVPGKGYTTGDCARMLEIGSVAAGQVMAALERSGRVVRAGEPPRLQFRRRECG